jgi:single-stranded DNA-binding protein
MEIISGNIGRNAETKTTKGGKDYAEFSVALYNGKDRPATWATVRAFGAKADDFQKGKRVQAIGTLDIAAFKKRDDSLGTSIVMLTSKVEATEELGSAAIVYGNVGMSPEHKTSKGGKAYYSFPVYVHSGKDDAKKSTRYNVVYFSDEAIDFDKGDFIKVHGSLAVEAYDKDGKLGASATITTFKVEKVKGEESSSSGSAEPGRETQLGDDFDDDLPF